MRILVIDDHTLFRDGVRLLLQELGPSVEVIEASGCEEILHDAGMAAPELLLLDLALPGLEELDGLRAFRRLWPDVPIVILSGHDDVATIKVAIGAGARGYVTKAANSQEMLKALDLVLSGGRYVPPHARDALAGSEAPPLTARQRRVLACLAEGLSNRDIAERLDVAESTVRVHVSAVLSILGAPNRTRAARMALDRGLVDDDPPR